MPLAAMSPGLLQLELKIRIHVPDRTQPRTPAHTWIWIWTRTRMHCAFYFIIAMYVHHLGLYCILFRRFLIPKINVALQLTKL